VRRELERAVVHALRPGRRALDRIRVTEHHRGRAEELQVDAVPIHLLDAARRVPQRGVYRAEGLVVLHDVAGTVGVRAQPRRLCAVELRRFLPRDAREEVGVHVDDHWAIRAACQALASRPGWIVPHFLQRRAASLET
jgi:hypothetical protein